MDPMRRLSFLRPLFTFVAAGTLLGACAPANPILTGGDPGAAGCSTNTPPAIANVELFSWFDEALSSYYWSIHFDWRDPYPSENGDPPNLVGGYISLEVLTYDADSRWFDEATLTTACDSGMLDECTDAGHGMTGCPEGAVDTCTQGEMTFPFSSFDGPLIEGQELVFEFRVRDRCGASSLDKGGSYVIGSGRVSESGSGGDGGDAS